jgi:hypoxanthine phosphoribosyltransferase
MRVRTLGEAELSDAAAQLYKLACNDFQPDLLLGVRRGGYVVAEHMLTATATSSITLLPITRCRPTTIRKNKSTLINTLVRKLPRLLSDRLRVIEHMILTENRPLKPTAFAPDEAELANSESFLLAHPNAQILVVDDAVDTGATLAGILELLRVAAPKAAVRTAAIVTTTSRPLVEPDYSLYRHELCRFPWSLDFKA